MIKGYYEILLLEVKLTQCKDCDIRVTYDGKNAKLTDYSGVVRTYNTIPAPRNKTFEIRLDKNLAEIKEICVIVESKKIVEKVSFILREKQSKEVILKEENNKVKIATFKLNLDELF